MNIKYEEKVPIYPAITALVLITCLIFLIVLLSQFTERAIPMTMIMKIGLLVLFLLTLVVLISFRELTILVTDKQVIFGYGRFQKKFYLVDIENIDFGEYKFRNYLGYGIRYGLDKTIGYTPRGGRGLKLKFKNDKSVYFIVSARPEELKRILEQPHY